MSYGFPSGGIFAQPLGIGGHGGTEFTECKTDTGLLVKKLGIWYSDQALQAIQVTYTDDSVGPIYGTSHKSYSEITLAPNEIVTKASLWGDGVGKRAGHIQLVTNQNQHFDVGKNVKGQNEYPIQIGSGILAGVCGRKGAEIDMLALIFLRPIDSIQITDLEFGALPKGAQGPQSKILDTTTQYNTTKGDITWTFSNALQKTNTKTISSTTTNTFGVKATVGVKVSAKLPIIDVGVEASASTEIGWSIAWAKMEQTATTDQITLTWSISGKMAAGDEPVICTASAVYGENEFPYTSKTTLSFVNPTASLSYTEKGLFKTQQWVNATAKAENSKGVVATTSTTAQSTALAAGNPASAPAPASAPGFKDRKHYLIHFLLYARRGCEVKLKLTLSILLR